MIMFIFIRCSADDLHACKICSDRLDSLDIFLDYFFFRQSLDIFTKCF